MHKKTKKQKQKTKNKKQKNKKTKKQKKQKQKKNKKTKKEKKKAVGAFGAHIWQRATTRSRSAGPSCVLLSARKRKYGDTPPRGSGGACAVRVHFGLAGPEPLELRRLRVLGGGLAFAGLWRGLL